MSLRPVKSCPTIYYTERPRSEQPKPQSNLGARIALVSSQIFRNILGGLERYAVPIALLALTSSAPQAEAGWKCFTECMARCAGSTGGAFPLFCVAGCGTFCAIPGTP